jgi:hypothetical protein
MQQVGPCADPTLCSVAVGAAVVCCCCSGNYFTYQLMLATTDLRLHTTYDPAGKMTPSDVQQEQYTKIMVSRRAVAHCTLESAVSSSTAGPQNVTLPSQPVHKCCSCQAEHTESKGTAALMHWRSC